MEDLENPSKPIDDYSSNIDSSRPFRSVKEAVAIFGEKFLAGEIYAPKTKFSFPHQETPKFYTPSPSPQQQKSQQISSASSSFDYGIEEEQREEMPNSMMMESLKKLEAELEETKMELKLLKERESETEVGLASLNAELHKNMSKLAQAEADKASKALALISRSNSGIVQEQSNQENGFKEEDKRRDLIGRLETSRTLAQVLNCGDEHKKKKKMMRKMKPIIPLVGDLFSRKKGNSTSIHNPLFSSTHMNLN